jgi:hypothetical protein
MIPAGITSFFKIDAPTVDEISKTGLHARPEGGLERCSALGRARRAEPMATGWIAWALLLAGATGAADDLVPFRQRNLRIPVDLRADRRAEVQSMILYLSRDQGKHWEEYARAAPDKRGFDFTAPADGIYWFSVVTVNKSGMKDPPYVERAPVGQKVLIDTIKPDVHITTAERKGDQILVRWEVIDANPDWNSLRLEYRVGASPSGDWVPIQIMPGAQGNQYVRPAIPGEVTLRLSLTDLAGNVGEHIVSVPAATTAEGMVDRSVVGAGAVEQPFRPADTGAPLPPHGPTTGSLSSPMAVSPPVQSTVAKPPPSGPPSETEKGPTGSHASLPGEAGPSTTAPMPPRLGALPPLKIINKKQVKLDFNVVKYGPSGLGSVDVYVTTDEGANWAKSEGTPEVSLPVSGEVRNTAPVRGSVTVQLPREGIVYGFYLVVKSRAGRGKPAPTPGTPPQVRIEVDTTMPLAELFKPQADESGRRDSLTLIWKAEDKNLAANPVTLEWAANKNGPWEFIGDPQLPNTGRYSWQIGDRVPPKVFLRLTVRDTAGNVAVAQTSEPVLIDLSEPEVEPNIGISVR